MKVQFLTALASFVAASVLLGADLEVILMESPKDGPSPFIVDPNDSTPLMVFLSERDLEILTSDDPNTTPKMRLAETRVIHDVKEGQVYKIVPDSIGLNGYQNLEFSYRRLKNGFLKVEFVRGIGMDRTRTKLTMKSHVVLELRNATTERSIFCALGVKTGGQQGGSDEPATVPKSHKNENP
ncbi:hypothetical protein V2O64_24185 (plasmid) [Verrucomicrobiaceae bacterium 227]